MNREQDGQRVKTDMNGGGQRVKVDGEEGAFRHGWGEGSELRLMG